MKIIDELNNILVQEKSIIRLRYDGKFINIVPVEDKFVKETSIMNMTDDFYQFLEIYCFDQDYRVFYNNTRSCFWLKKIERE